MPFVNMSQKYKRYKKFYAIGILKMGYFVKWAILKMSFFSKIGYFWVKHRTKKKKNTYHFLHEKMQNFVVTLERCFPKSHVSRLSWLCNIMLWHELSCVITYRPRTCSTFSFLLNIFYIWNRLKTLTIFH